MPHTIDLKNNPVPNSLPPEQGSENFSKLRARLADLRARLDRRAVLICLIILAVILFGVWLKAIFATPPWRAVFLTNNQVYFGHFRDWQGGDYITLTDIYYLQLGQGQLQTGGPAPELKVVKLGSEIHGPKDMMVIPKTQILFWEDLRDDSQVVQAIVNMQKNK